MDFADRLLKLDGVLRDFINYSIAKDIFMQKKIAGDTNIDARRLKRFYEPDPDTELSVSEVTRLIGFIVAFDFSEWSSQDEKLAEKLKTLEECCDMDIGEGQHIQVSPKTAGDPTDLDALAGVYHVLRRVIGKDLLVVSAIEIKYNEARNLCTWNNFHKAVGGGRHIGVNGVVTQSKGVFYFMGFLQDQSTLHAMSLPKGNNWDEISGIVMTQAGLTPMASRVVLCRTKSDFAAAIEKCGDFAIEEASQFGLSSPELLNNTCSSTGVLQPASDF